MTIKRQLLYLTSLIYGIMTTIIAMEDSLILNQLKVDRTEEHLLIGGLVENIGSSTEELTYHLDVEKSGSSGTTRTSQSGKLQIEAGSTSEISTTRIGIRTGDHGTITLKIKDESEEVVSSSSLNFEIW